MNRAMGFGVLTRTMLGTTALTAAPASAHDQRQESDFGSVLITNNHSVMVVTDFICGDGIGMAGRLKTPSGGIIDSRGADCIDFSRLVAPGVGFQKCIVHQGKLGCSDWQRII